MINPFGPLSLAIVPVLLTACMSPSPAVGDQSANAGAVPLGVDLGSSAAASPAGPSIVPPGEGHERTTDRPGEMKMAHEGRKDTHATGTVNSVDAAQHKINISHNPIPEIGWPAMTMDFPVASSVDLRSVKPGMRVNFTFEQGQGGMPEIQSLTPSGGSR
jgi:Cu/Ag efflux protein CusF